MKRNMAFRPVILLLLICSLCLASSAQADQLSFIPLLNGQSDNIRIGITSPEFLQLAQFGESRLSSLNRLLAHLEVELSSSGTDSQLICFVDHEPVFTQWLSASEEETTTIWSFRPDTAYLTDPQRTEHSLISFLDQDYFPLNRLLDEMYPLFQNISAAFPEYAKGEKVNLNYKGFGKAVLKTTLRFSADFVGDHFPGSLSELSAFQDCSAFIQSIFFEGPQRITVFTDQDHQPVKILYDGVAGFSADSLRKISLSWKCLRSDDCCSDELALKTPAVKGYDKYNLSYSRIISTPSDADHSLRWDYQLDFRKDQARKKIQYICDLSSDSREISGTIRFEERQNDQSHTIQMNPAFHQENSSGYTGLLEITGKSGKIVTGRAVVPVSLSLCEPVFLPAVSSAVDLRKEENKPVIDSLQKEQMVLLIRKLMALPKTDITFLSQDIPDALWNSLADTTVQE